MLRTERWEEPANAVSAAIEGKQSQLWTAIPGIVQSFNAAHNTVEVQPSVQRRVRRPDGKWINETLSLCVDVPVHFPSGGGFSLTVPVKQGDECLLVFSSRCIDGWWAKGGVQPQTIPRMHNPSDGFAILGTRSKAKALANVSTSTVQLRSDDGKTLIEIDGSQTVRLVAPTKVRIETPTLEVTGTIKASGDVQANAALANATLSVSPASGNGGGSTRDVSPATVQQAILHVSSEVPQLLAVGDNFTVQGAVALATNALGQVVPGASQLINTAHQVASIIDSHNFTALIPLLPGIPLPSQITQIIGSPTVQAVVRLLSHDHFGVHAGPDISQKPVTGT
jgi:hypothetical protein